jgi:amidohydrolase family protein
LLALGLPPLGAGTLLFQHSTVIGMTGAPPLRDVSVLIEGDRITAVARQIQPPRDAQVVDATGKFLIPGLWDMHMHLGLPETFFPLLVAHGVTGVREMFSGIPLPEIQQWRASSGVPRIVASAFLDGPLMLSSGLIAPGAIAVGTPDQARFAVRLLARSGYDFLKVYNSLPREAYFAIARESRALGIPFAGHVPEEVSPAEAAEAGQRSQEHLINILLACSTQEEALRAERARVMYSDRISGEERLRLLGFPQPEGLFDTYSPEKAARLFATFVRTGTWQVPTLALLHGFAYGDDFVKDPRARYLPESWRRTAHPRDKSYMRDLTPPQFDALVARIRALLERHKKLVGDMHRAGVQFLAGTDASLTNPVIPGAGLHLELALLVESGLTPYQALETATRNPARYLGMLDWLGTIEPNKAADLVLLDADPLADIHNTEKIRAVVMRGRYFPRAELDSMLERLARARPGE